MKKLMTIGLAGAIALGSAMSSQAAEVTLKFAHFWPSVAGPNTKIFEVWKKTVEEESGGRIKVDIFPSQTLAKAPAQYEAVKNRIADMTATVLGYTANRFPLAQVVELPGIVKTAKQGSCMVQTVYNEGLISSEFEDTHPLFLFTHGPGQIHTKGEAITKPEDFNGMRVRRPTTIMGDMLKSLGAQPVGMPAPQIYQSMQRGVINGVALPWEGVKGFRINELADQHTEIDLYSIVFLVTMNKDVYNGLPADLKKVIDDNSGLKWSEIAAKVFDDLDVQGRADAVKLGHNIVKIKDGINNPAWKPTMEAVKTNYLEGLEAKGKPAKKVFDRITALSQSCS